MQIRTYFDNTEKIGKTRSERAIPTYKFIIDRTNKYIPDHQFDVDNKFPLLNKLTGYCEKVILLLLYRNFADIELETDL